MLDHAANLLVFIEFENLYKNNESTTDVFEQRVAALKQWCCCIGNLQDWQQ